jgi:hypothetical protein
MSRETFELARDLYRELSGWDEHQSLDFTRVRLDLLKHRQGIGQCLAGAGLGLAYQVSALQERRYRLGLNGERLAETHVPYTLEKAGV